MSWRFYGIRDPTITAAMNRCFGGDRYVSGLLEAPKTLPLLQQQVNSDRASRMSSNTTELSKLHLYLFMTIGQEGFESIFGRVNL